MNIYETDELLQQYLEFHYGESYFGVENYPAACANHCLRLMGDRPKTKALDLGCAVGRTSFELAREFDQVVGVDLSANFIATASHIQQQGQLAYSIIDEGELTKPREASLKALGLQETSQQIEFVQDDACNLSERHSDYDLIFAGNLLDRLYDPGAFLQSIHQYLTTDGILVMSSPYTLLEEYTPRDNWVGGFLKNDERFSVLEGMLQHLAGHFEMLEAPQDVPFVIRETRRKFQHTIAELSSWQRL